MPSHTHKRSDTGTVSKQANPKTQQQARAEYALNQIKKTLAAHSDDDRFKQDFKSYASSFPAMIQMNGLGQAAAFYRSKKGTHEALYHILSDWLTSGDRPYQQHQDLLEALTTEGMSDYLLAQAEALALLGWLKKFANTFIPRSPS